VACRGIFGCGRPSLLRWYPGAGAVADPDGTGAEQAAQLPGAGRIGAIARAQREILCLARLEAAALAGRATLTGPWCGKPVVRVWPGGRLIRIEPGPVDLFGEHREMVPAALPYRRERDRVPGQVEGDLEWLARAVVAGHGGHGQHRAIDAT
jgi:hypothetical protein